MDFSEDVSSDSYRRRLATSRRHVTTIAMTMISAPMAAMIEISVVWLTFSGVESEI